MKITDLERGTLQQFANSDRILTLTLIRFTNVMYRKYDSDNSIIVFCSTFFYQQIRPFPCQTKIINLSFIKYFSMRNSPIGRTLIKQIPESNIRK